MVRPQRPPAGRRRHLPQLLHDSRAAEELSSIWALLDITPFGRQEEWQDAPEGVPQDPIGSWTRRHDEYTDDYIGWAPPSMLDNGRYVIPHATREATDGFGAFEASVTLRGVSERNVLGEPLEPCGHDPVTGFFRDGSCSTGAQDRGSHTICAVVTAEFLAHQRANGNDLGTPMPQFQFPGLVPGDRWCVTAANWLRAHHDGVAAFVVLASTNERALDLVPFEALAQHAVDVPADPGPLAG